MRASNRTLRRRPARIAGRIPPAVPGSIETAPAAGPRKGKSRRRRGSTIVWLVAMLPMLIGLAGLVIDTAWFHHAGHQLQTVADASALAASRHLRTDVSAARGAAANIAALNSVAGDAVLLDANAANAPGGDIVVGTYDRPTRTFTPTTVNPNAVRVVARRIEGSGSGPLPLIFGAVAGISSAQLERSAIAMVSGGSGSGIITLAPDGDCTLDVGGNGTLTINDGSVHVNSVDDCAMCGYGNADLEVGQLDVVGEACMWGNFHMNGSWSNGAASISDPLAALPDPPTGTVRPAVPNNGNTTIQPGYYANGISRTGGTLTCQPGVYYLDGPAGNCNSGGFRVSGNAVVIANGCTFFVRRGGVRLTGNGALTITPPDSGTYAHITFFQARDNTCSNDIRGNNNTTVAGTIYLPAAHLDLRGNGTVTGFEQIIVNTMAVSGNGTLIVNYHGEFPSGTPATYLVD